MNSVGTLPGTAVEGAFELLDAIDELYADASTYADLRREDRRPFLRPLWVESEFLAAPIRAFSRDLSPRGIGLLHEQLLPPTDVILTILLEGERQLRLRATIDWCQPFGDGWYLSGGQFVCVEPGQYSHGCTHGFHAPCQAE